MTIRLKVLVTSGCAAVFGICLWRNKKSYTYKSWKWLSLKSLVDSSIICLTAWKFPAILVAWCAIWFVRPCKDPMWRVVIGAIAGGIFGFLELYCFELVVIASVWAVDLVTGNAGFLGRYREVTEGSHADNERQEELA